MKKGFKLKRFNAMQSFVIETLKLEGRNSKPETRNRYALPFFAATAC